MAPRGDPRSFLLNVQAWCKKAEMLTEQAVQEGAMDIVRELVRRTPRGTEASGTSSMGLGHGWLQGSWYARVGGTPGGPVSRANPIPRLFKVIRTLRIGENLRIGNTAPYARRLEFGFVGEDSWGRTYNQTGRYFVRMTLNEAPALARRAAERVARRGGG